MSMQGHSLLQDKLNIVMQNEIRCSLLRQPYVQRLELRMMPVVEKMYSTDDKE